MLDLGAASRQGRGWAGEEEGKGREEEVEGREREGPQLLLNQGPLEPCYATAELYVISGSAAKRQRQRHGIAPHNDAQ